MEPLRLLRIRPPAGLLVEPRLIVKVRHFGRIGDGYLRFPALEGFCVVGEGPVSR